MKNEVKIYTHIRPDLDAASSVWAAKEFIPAAKEAQVEFRPAHWDGSGMGAQDLALDINAGGRGIKGKKDRDGIVHSCFATIVEENAQQDDQKAIKNLVRFVDEQDSYGCAAKRLINVPGEKDGTLDEARNVFASTGINAVLRALQSKHRSDDYLVLERMSDIFSGLLSNGRARQRAEKEALQAQIVPGNKVAIVTNSKEFATNGVLFDQGIKAIVYKDGFNLGITRSGDEQLRMDHPAILKVIELAGEKVGDGPGEWFAHPAGFLLCRGSRKAPAENFSKVNPEALARIVTQLIEVAE